MLRVANMLESLKVLCCDLPLFKHIVIFRQMLCLLVSSLLQAEAPLAPQPLFFVCHGPEVLNHCCSKRSPSSLDVDWCSSFAADPALRNLSQPLRQRHLPLACTCSAIPCTPDIYQAFLSLRVFHRTVLYEPPSDKYWFCTAELRVSIMGSKKSSAVAAKLN